MVIRNKDVTEKETRNDDFCIEDTVQIEDTNGEQRKTVKNSNCKSNNKMKIVKEVKASKRKLQFTSNVSEQCKLKINNMHKYNGVRYAVNTKPVLCGHLVRLGFVHKRQVSAQ